MRIVIFGTGKLYQEFKVQLSNSDEIIAFLDNSEDKWGKKLDGVIVCNPQEVRKLEYDKIVLMSKYALDMKLQLIQYGCCEKKIMHCEEYYNLKKDKKCYFYPASRSYENGKKRCAIICKSLGYHGGAIAAFYCALALQECGITTDIVAEDGNSSMISEINKNEISVIIAPAISMEKWEEMQWLEKYDYVIVNTMPMILSAIEIAKYRTVIMWLHDSDNIYEYMNYWRDEIMQGINNEKLKICAVSKIAKNNFCQWIKNYPIDILPCGVPDDECTNSSNSKLIFSTIGSIHPIKGQDIMLQAIKKLPSYLLEQAEFWIIGKGTDEVFYQNIAESARNIACVKIIGEVEKEELNKLYSKMDIVVVPSRKETMSLVAIEAMLHGKLCIVSEAAGISEYLTDGENGLRFTSEDVDNLAKKIRWCIENTECMLQMKANARAIYEQYFSMSIFKKNLLHILSTEGNLMFESNEEILWEKI